MKTNCTVYTKVFFNQRTDAYRVLATFDKSKRDSTGRIIVTVQNAVFRSGDIATGSESEAARARAVERTLAQVREVCRTDNIVLV